MNRLGVSNENLCMPTGKKLLPAAARTANDDEPGLEDHVVAMRALTNDPCLCATARASGEPSNVLV